MKSINNISLILIALLTASFTIATNLTAFNKKAIITNCYQNVSGEYLSVCSQTINWMNLTCANKNDALNKTMRNTYSFSYSNYITTNLECVGTSTVCCIQFMSQSNDPCLYTEYEKQGDGNIRDNQNNTINMFDYVKIKSFECKNN